MVVVAALAGVIILVLVVAVAMLRRRATESASRLVDAERRLVLADERAERSESDVRAADARRTTAEDRATALEGELADAKTAVAAAEAARDEAVERAQDADARAVAARDAGARLIEASALRSDAGGLWFLEAVGVERRWRATQGTPDAPLFDGDREPASVALEAVAEIIREESGTSFDVDWRVDEPVPPSVALAVVRAGDELLSALAVASDGGVLEVHPVPDGVQLALRVEPEPALPPDLLAVFGVLGWELSLDQGDAPATVLTIPFTPTPAS